MEDINKNIENLIDNVDYLIEFLERTNREKSDETDFSSLELNQNIKGFEKYLKSIQENTSHIKEIKDNLNAYFQNIEPLQPKVEEAVNKPLNTDLEQSHFIEIQNEIQLLTDKIGDLANTLNQAGIKLDLNVDSANLEQIKQQLEELKLAPQINFDAVITQLEEVRKNFESLQNLDFNNVDFEVLNVDKIDSILKKVSEFKNISIGFNKEDMANLDKLEQSLQSIKGIDFKNLESLKELDNLQLLKEIDFGKISKDISNIDLSSKFKDLENLNIDPIIEKINTLKDIKLDNLALDIDVKEDIIKKVDNINTKISELKDNLSNIDFTSDLFVNVDTEKVKDNIREDLKNVDVNIKPTIDLTEIESIERKEYKIKIKTEVDDSNLDFKNVSIKPIQNQKEYNDNNTKILEQLTVNNEIMRNIATHLATTSQQSIENNVTNISSIGENKNITEVKPVENIIDTNTALLQATLALLEKTNAIHLELMKSNFDNSSPLG